MAKVDGEGFPATIAALSRDFVGGMMEQKNDDSVADCGSQITVAEIATPIRRSAESLRFVNTDRIAGMLGDYPELKKAVRAGDVATVSRLCAELFESNSAAQNGRRPVSNAA